MSTPVPNAEAARKPFTPVPGAYLALALLVGINLFNVIDRYVLSSCEVQIRQEFFPDDPRGKVWTGWLATAFLLSYMIMAPVFGWMADRVKRWWLIGAGVMLWSLASGGSGLAPRIAELMGTSMTVAFGLMLASRAFVGLGEAAYGPAAPTVISDLFPVQKRGQVLAWFYLALPVGGAIGFALGGFMAAHFGWRWAFYSVVPPGLLLGALCFFMIEPKRGQVDIPPPILCPACNRAIPGTPCASVCPACGAPIPAMLVAPAASPAALQRYAVLLRTPSYVLNTLGMAAMTFAVGGIAFWMPTYIHEFRYRKSIGEDKVGMAFGLILAVSGLAATLLGGFVGDKLRDRYPGSYFLVSGVGMIVGFPAFVAALYAPLWLMWPLIFVACFCLFFNTGPTNTILANVTHPSIRASAFALNIFVIHLLGDAISPPIIGWISYAARDSSGRDNMNAGFLVVSFAVLLSGVLWLWGARYLEKDTRLAPTRL